MPYKDLLVYSSHFEGGATDTAPNSYLTYTLSNMCDYK